MTEDDRPRIKTRGHELGEALDTLSLHEFDERLALLHEEIARLETARERKRSALDAAGSVFGRR